MVFKRTFLGFIPFGLEPQLNDKYFENMKHPFFINHHYIFFIVSVANSRHVLKCPLDHFQSQEEFYLSGLLGKENDFLPKISPMIKFIDVVISYLEKRKR